MQGWTEALAEIGVMFSRLVDGHDVPPASCPTPLGHEVLSPVLSWMALVAGVPPPALQACGVLPPALQACGLLPPALQACGVSPPALQACGVPPPALHERGVPQTSGEQTLPESSHRSDIAPHLPFSK